MMWKHRLLTISVISAVGPACWCTFAWAQEGEGDTGAGTTPPPAATVKAPEGGNTTVVVTPPVTTTTTETTTTPWGVPPAGYDPDKGLPSSDREAGSSQFDLNMGNTATVHGSGEGAFSGTGQQAMSVPAYHTVRRGDTLWDLCNHYYDNPWAWPRVWSFNPQVQNPNWIYPGDRLQLRAAPTAGTAPQSAAGEAFVMRQSMVPQGTVFLRDEGYIADEARDVWGEVIGSPGDTMLLAEGDQVYLQIKGNHNVQIGQEFTIFEKTRRPEAGDSKGYIVRFKGTAKVTRWNEKTHIAEATLTESLDVIERGALIGPIGRRFDVVPPVPNDREVWGHIAAAVEPRELIGQNQVVFIDKGSKDGLRPGNRLFVVEQGDRWRDSLRMGRAMAANRVHFELRKAEITTAPDTARGEADKLPREVIGEIRVLRTEPHSALCVVTSSVRELEPGFTVVARRGY